MRNGNEGIILHVLNPLILLPLPTQNFLVSSIQFSENYYKLYKKYTINECLIMAYPTPPMVRRSRMNVMIWIRKSVCDSNYRNDLDNWINGGDGSSNSLKKFHEILQDKKHVHSSLNYLDDVRVFPERDHYDMQIINVPNHCSYRPSPFLGSSLS